MFISGEDLFHSEGIHYATQGLSCSPDISPGFGFTSTLRAKFHGASITFLQVVCIEARSTDTEFLIVTMNAGKQRTVDNIFGSVIDQHLFLGLVSIGFFTGNKSRTNVGKISP
jgi:hypothetical protein